MTDYNSNSIYTEFSVVEISNQIKEILEHNFDYLRIRGEISGFKIAASGHGYFNLKENNALLACTCWKQVISRLKFHLSDGMEVIAIGKIVAYAGNSRYQLSVEMLEESGFGAFIKILKERKEMLRIKGVFDKQKKDLPLLPSRIGIITSITGAVIKDIIHRINDRCPVHLLIWPVTVQGESAQHEITRAIDGFNEFVGEMRPDVIIIARGGGSIEDLWAFNEESVIMSVYRSRIPVISAVGHETDNTLVDLVSDKRAPTPTAAAEFVVPVLSHLKEGLNCDFNFLFSKITYVLKYKVQTLEYKENFLMKIFTVLENKQQFLDDLLFKLVDSIETFLHLKVFSYKSLSDKNLNPRNNIEILFQSLDHTIKNLSQAIRHKIFCIESQIALYVSLLDSLDLKKTLNRGFVVAISEDRKLLNSKLLAEKEKKFSVLFNDGELVVKSFK